MSTPNTGPNRKWIRISNPVTPIVLDFGKPLPDRATTPKTELIVQLTIAAEAHPDDVAEVMERIQAAIKDATSATGGRIDIQLALPEIVKSRNTTAPSAAAG